MSTPPKLTDRQQSIMAYIRSAVRDRGYPPSVREIGEAVGLRSTSSVHSQLAALEKAGWLRRDPSRPRAMEVRDPGHDAVGGSSPDAASTATTDVPLLGEIAAGAPTIAEEQITDHYSLPRQLVGDGTLFMLRVKGESMLDAGVHPGDLVVVRQQPTVEQGEMCAAMIDGEATVKFLRRTKAGELFLDPANAAYEPIPVPPTGEASILGKVTAVLRSV